MYFITYFTLCVTIFVNLFISIIYANMNKQLCDVSFVESLIYANCSGRNLPTIPGELRKDIQYLNLDSNQIEILSDNIFENYGYKKIQKLSIAHNELKYISTGAFNGLERTLRELDLSRNKLENIPTIALQQVRHSIRKLILSGNPFVTVPARSFQRLTILENLSMDRCSLSEIDENAFVEMGALNSLNLAYNRFHGLNPIVFSPIINTLWTLRLYGNPWICDCKTKELYSWLVEKKSISNWHFGIGSPTCERPHRLGGMQWHRDELSTDLFICPPEITFTNQSEPMLGSTLILLCIAAGEPLPMIKWFKDNKTVYNDTIRYNIIEYRTFNYTSSKLIIDSIADVDKGLYLCQSQNGGGTVFKTFRLSTIPLYSSLQNTEDMPVIANRILTIVILVVGSLLILLTALVIVYFCQRKRSRRNRGVYKTREIHNVQDILSINSMSNNTLLKVSPTDPPNDNEKSITSDRFHESPSLYPNEGDNDLRKKLLQTATKQNKLRATRSENGLLDTGSTDDLLSMTSHMTQGMLQEYINEQNFQPYRSPYYNQNHTMFLRNNYNNGYNNNFNYNGLGTLSNRPNSRYSYNPRQQPTHYSVPKLSAATLGRRNEHKINAINENSMSISMYQTLHDNPDQPNNNSVIQNRAINNNHISPITLHRMTNDSGVSVNEDIPEERQHNDDSSGEYCGVPRQQKSNSSKLSKENHDYNKIMYDLLKDSRKQSITNSTVMASIDTSQLLPNGGNGDLMTNSVTHANGLKETDIDGDIIDDFNSIVSSDDKTNSSIASSSKSNSKSTIKNPLVPTERKFSLHNDKSYLHEDYLSNGTILNDENKHSECSLPEFDEQTLLRLLADHQAAELKLLEKLENYSSPTHKGGYSASLPRPTKNAMMKKSLTLPQVTPSVMKADKNDDQSNNNNGKNKLLPTLTEDETSTPV